MRQIRFGFIPILCFLILLTGVSAGLTGTNPFNTGNTSDEIVLDSQEVEEAPEPEDEADEEETDLEEADEEETDEVDEPKGPRPEKEAREPQPATGAAGEDKGRPAWSTEGCPEGFEGNHGQYVSSQPETDEDRREAAKSDCGKPVRPEDEDSEEEGSED